jgi:hypothetical protein
MPLRGDHLTYFGVQLTRGGDQKTATGDHLTSSSDYLTEHAVDNQLRGGGRSFEPALRSSGDGGHRAI